MLNIKALGLVVSKEKNCLGFSYSALVKYLIPGAGPFLDPGSNLNKLGRV